MPGILARVTTLGCISILLTACAHTPTESIGDRPAPEPKTTDAPSGETQPTQTDEQTAETADGASSSPESDAATESADAAKTRKLTISLNQQAFTYAEDDQVVRVGPISSGAQGYPTPTGQFAVLSKDKDKVSSRYTNQLGMQAWMPYSLQFHGNYFLHEGWLPGYPDSHGCIRLGEKDARFLFETMKIGDPVIVAK
ncbi:L,D-transpeptidase [Thiocystis violacea]|uniref:L,D-transpeptidase n=1 Tax=Thiocystis violacea TaxID=13725 RepID=UPI0019083D7D|nr:L,D-transpeptidase [Thiocystis violacea]MBK1722356.1 L,D-transpeptidase [Thiocystis violacea]